MARDVPARSGNNGDAMRIAAIGPHVRPPIQRREKRSANKTSTDACYCERFLLMIRDSRRTILDATRCSSDERRRSSSRMCSSSPARSTSPTAAHSIACIASSTIVGVGLGGVSRESSARR